MLVRFLSRADHLEALVLIVWPVELPGQFCVWLASPEAKFLNRKFVWANWDVEEMMERADEIKNSKLLDWMLEGVPM
jgi:hypothetical protein